MEIVIRGLQKTIAILVGHIDGCSGYASTVSRMSVVTVMLTANDVMLLPEEWIPNNIKASVCDIPPKGH